MTGFAGSTFGAGLAITLGAALVLFVWSWLLGLRLGRFNVVDATWGASFVLVALVAFAWTDHARADLARRVLVLVMVALWGGRLSSYIAVRSRGKGEDPRYDALLGRAAAKSGRSVGTVALRSVFLTQAVIAWFISFPVQAAMAVRSGLDAIAWVGVAVWVVGVFFESVGDAQMAAFRRDPANKGQVMDRGLWHYTRHPNYFGDACVWVGLWLVAAQSWQGALTFLSPAAMVWFLAFKTGKPLLEKQMAESKPGYAEYMRRTSGFIPLPPRH